MKTNYNKAVGIFDTIDSKTGKVESTRIERADVSTVIAVDDGGSITVNLNTKLNDVANYRLYADYMFEDDEMRSLFKWMWYDEVTDKNNVSTIILYKY